jgi:hypothetical protein
VDIRLAKMAILSWETHGTTIKHMIFIWDFSGGYIT